MIQVMTIRFSQALDSSTVRPDGGDAQNFGIYVLHHIAGLGPHISRRCRRLCEQGHHAGPKETGVKDAPIVPVLFLGRVRERAFSVQSITSFFVPKNENSAHPTGRCPFTAGA